MGGGCRGLGGGGCTVTPRVSGCCHLNDVNAEPMGLRNSQRLELI